MAWCDTDLFNNSSPVRLYGACTTKTIMFSLESIILWEDFTDGKSIAQWDTFVLHIGTFGAVVRKEAMVGQILYVKLKYIFWQSKFTARLWPCFLFPSQTSSLMAIPLSALIILYASLSCASQFLKSHYY